MKYLNPIKRLKNNLILLSLLIGINFAFSQQTSNRLIVTEGYLVQKKTFSDRVKHSNMESEKIEHYEYFFLKDSVLKSSFMQDVLSNDICTDSSLFKLIFQEQVSDGFDFYNILNKSVFAISNDFLDYSGIKGAFDKGVFDGKRNVFCSDYKQIELQNIFECTSNQVLNRIEKLQLITKSTEYSNNITEVSSIYGSFIFVFGKKLMPDFCIKNCFVFISTLY
jgi:hypothetical protein